MNLKKHLMLSCAAIGFSSFALIAQAHDHAGSSCKDQANKEECRAEMMAKFKAERDVREAKLHKELNITEKQEQAWQNFTNSFQPPTAMNAEERKALSAPERLKHKIAHMQTRLDALNKLYAVLSPEQRTMLDEKLTRFEKHRWDHRGHGDRKQDQPPATAQ